MELSPQAWGGNFQSASLPCQHYTSTRRMTPQRVFLVANCKSALSHVLYCDMKLPSFNLNILYTVWCQRVDLYWYSHIKRLLR